MTVVKSAKHKPKNKSAAQPAAKLSLAETQAVFQKALLDGDEAILAMVHDNSRTSRDRLFDVYRNAYSGRLSEILAQDYEYLAAYVGCEVFHALAQTYISLHPSRSQNARWFGSRFPFFLRNLPSHGDHPEYADLAGLEKALSDAFDASDADPLTIANLAQNFAPDDWGRLIFSAHPSVTLVPVETDTFTLWKAMKAGEAPPAALVTGSRYLIAWRQDGTPMVREMGDEEAMMWIEASRGARFEVLCELLATFEDADQAAARAAGYLQGWLSTGMLASADLSPEA